MIEIPLSSEPEQLFSTFISGVKYSFRVIYGIRSGWSISIYRGEEVLKEGLALKSGVDLLRPYNFGIGEMYLVNLDNPNQEADSDNLGSSVKLFIVSEEDY